MDGKSSGGSGFLAGCLVLDLIAVTTEGVTEGLNSALPHFLILFLATYAIFLGRWLALSLGTADRAISIFNGGCLLQLLQPLCLVFIDVFVTEVRADSDSEVLLFRHLS